MNEGNKSQEKNKNTKKTLNILDKILSLLQISFTLIQDVNYFGKRRNIIFNESSFYLHNLPLSDLYLD